MSDHDTAPSQETTNYVCVVHMISLSSPVCGVCEIEAFRQRSKVAEFNRLKSMGNGC